MVQAAKQVRIAECSSITIAIPVGTVNLPNGRFLSYLTDPKAYALQPDHTYLLVVTYKPSGQFFVLNKSWDVTTGVVRPNSSHEATRYAQGRSHLVGLPIDVAVSEIKKRLATK